jgi:hypothetical protein
MAVVAAEGFINELTELSGMRAASGLHDATTSSTLASLSRLLELAEEQQGSLLLKYQLASQILSGRTFDPGCNPFQDFASLIKLRNLLVHFGPNDDFQEDGKGLATGNKHPRVVVALQQRGIAIRPQVGIISSWFDTLGTAKLADWACETAINMIMAVVDMNPPMVANFSLNMWAERAHRNSKDAKSEPNGG